MSSSDKEKNIITLDNVHKYSTFQLRQELERRGVSFKSMDVVNYNVLLQQMIQILCNEERKKEEEAVVNSKNGNHNGSVSVDKDSDDDRTTPTAIATEESVQERLQRQKMERKKEAMERSKQRQADKGYFLSKKLANEKGMEDAKQKCNNDINKDVLQGDDEDCHDSNNIGTDVTGDNGVEDSNQHNNTKDVGDTCKVNNPFQIRFQPKIGGRFS